MLLNGQRKKAWQILIFVLSMYVVVQFLYELIIPLTEFQSEVTERIDTFICCVFLADFFYFLTTSSDKRLFFRKNWLDLVSSFPFFEVLRFLRIVRIVRLFRLLKMIRMFRGLREIFPFIKYITKNKLRSILTAYVVFMIFVLFYCAAGFYVAERGIKESVNTYFDALWWAFITVTSVGYGDIFPKTTEGRIIAITLSLLGIGLFSIITAEIAAKFVQFMKEDENKDA